MKFKDKIRDKLKRWLFAEELSKFEAAEQNYKEAEDLYSRSAGYLNSAKDEYTWSLKMVDDCHKLINSMTDVGTDSFFFPSLHKLHSNLCTGFYLPDIVMDFDEISIGIGDSHIQSRLLHIFQKLN